MDLQTRKLNLISYLTEIQDEIFIEKIEKFIFNKTNTDSNPETRRFTKQDLLNRAEKSNRDYEKGRTISQEDLENISANW